MRGFDPAYLGTPPWDIGRPQAAVITLAQEGQFHGEALDVGCGTGENALYLASEGHRVWGVDASPRAIAKAQAKAQERNLQVTFQVWDALHLEGLRRRFDTLLDVGLFHIFSDAERLRYVSSLSAGLRPRGVYHMLCFSDAEPLDWGGPRRITQEEIREAFQEGWRVEAIRPARFESHFHADGGKAWLASVVRD